MIVHIPPVLEKTFKRKEKHEESSSCAHEILRQGAIQRLDHWFYILFLAYSGVFEVLRISANLIHALVRDLRLPHSNGRK